MKRGEGYKRNKSKAAALACSFALLLTCAGCSLNDVSSSVRSSTSGVERKAKEVPRNPDFSDVFHNGG